jgi:hypothetical protein
MQGEYEKERRGVSDNQWERRASCARARAIQHNAANTYAATTKQERSQRFARRATAFKFRQASTKWSNMLHHANELDLILLDEPNADAGLVIEKAEDEVDGLHHALCTLSHFRWLCDARGRGTKSRRG